MACKRRRARVAFGCDASTRGSAARGRRRVARVRRKWPSPTNWPSWFTWCGPSGCRIPTRRRRGQAAASAGNHPRSLRLRRQRCARTSPVTLWSAVGEPPARPACRLPARRSADRETIHSGAAAVSAALSERRISGAGRQHRSDANRTSRIKREALIRRQAGGPPVGAQRPPAGGRDQRGRAPEMHPPKDVERRGFSGGPLAGGTGRADGGWSFLAGLVD